MKYILERNEFNDFIDINHLKESVSPDLNYLKAKDYVNRNKYYLKNLWIDSLSENENEENLIGYYEISRTNGY